MPIFIGMMSTYQRKHYLKNKEKFYQRNSERLKKLQLWFKEYKSKLKCEKCGETHPATLDFHHKDPKEKDLNISRMVSNRVSTEKLQEEINKCYVWCSNCQRKHHCDHQD